jgi:hypothetical protein
MPITARTLVESKAVEQVQTTQYTAPTTATIIDKMTAINYSNLVVQNKSLQPGEAYTFPEIAGHILTLGDSISTLGSLAASMSLRVSGREIS